MLLAEVMVILQKDENKSASIVEDRKVIGKISLAELKDFLDEEVNGQKFYSYKLNFELRTVIEQMRRTAIKNKELEHLGRKQIFSFLGTSGYRIAGIMTLVLVVLGISIFLFSRGFFNARSSDYQTIATPKGKTYRIKLVDGSVVWLNAASSIQFPRNFNSGNRKVILKGQAYFEVAKQAGKTFQVETNAQTVEVLGTHFDVNAYANEKEIITTLLEGSVRVTPTEGANNGVVLKPGQQSVLVNRHIDVKPADADDTMSWVKGEFSFRDEPLEKIMHVIERWYDVDVVFEDESMKQASLGGVIVRKEGLSVALRLITLSRGVHFTIKDKQLFVNK